MRTTIDIHEPLLEEAKRLAAETGRRLGDVVNDALREMLSRHVEQGAGDRGRVVLPVYRGTGLAPGIDPRSHASMLDALEGESYRKG